MKKILYYSDCFFFAGCENMLANFINSKELNLNYKTKLIYRFSEEYKKVAETRLNKKKIEPVYLLTELDASQFVRSSNKLIALIQRFIIGVYLLVYKYYSIVRNALILRKVLIKEKPNIIHINNGGYPAATSCYSAVIAARMVNIHSIIYVVNNMAVGYSHPLRWFDYLLDRFICRSVSTFITGSDNAGRRLKTVLKLSDSKVITIRNGISQRKVLTSKEVFKRNNGIDEGKIVFTTVANMEERKGHIFLLQAIKKLKEDDKIKNSVFVLEGEGPLKMFVMDYIKTNNLCDCVKYINTLSIYDLYNITDVLILPSIRDEDFPNTIIEAMGMGIPSIGTEIAGIPEQINDHQNGLLIKPMNVEALYNAILEMIENKELRSECAKAAKVDFDNKYTSSISVSNYVKLYNKMTDHYG